MTKADEQFDLPELCRRSGVTERTVRYYIQRGLLPKPGAGRGPKYDEGYLNRLRLIRQLQSRHQPLGEIGAQLKGMSDVAVAEALGDSRSPGSSAADYIESLLRSGPESTSPARAGPRDAGTSVARLTPESALEPSTGSSAPRPATESWDRYDLADGLELHVRRPASRERNRRIERIIAAAERILKE